MEGTRAPLLDRWPGPHLAGGAPPGCRLPQRQQAQQGHHPCPRPRGSFRCHPPQYRKRGRHSSLVRLAGAGTGSRTPCYIRRRHACRHTCTHRGGHRSCCRHYLRGQRPRLLRTCCRLSIGTCFAALLPVPVPGSSTELIAHHAMLVSIPRLPAQQGHHPCLRPRGSFRCHPPQYRKRGRLARLAAGAGTGSRCACSCPRRGRAYGLRISALSYACYHTCTRRGGHRSCCTPRTRPSPPTSDPGISTSTETCFAAAPLWTGTADRRRRHRPHVYRRTHRRGGHHHTRRHVGRSHRSSDGGAEQT